MIKITKQCGHWNILDAWQLDDQPLKFHHLENGSCTYVV